MNDDGDSPFTIGEQVDNQVNTYQEFELHIPVALATLGGGLYVPPKWGAAHACTLMVHAASPPAIK